MDSFFPAQVAAFRLARHFLTEPAPQAALVDAVGRVGGVQAQVLSAAQLAAWARVDGLRREDVESALWRERTLVKTWTVRGTLHLVPANDYRVQVAALRRSRSRAEQRWLAHHDAAPSEVAAAGEAIREALAEGPATRKELAEKVAASLGERARHWVEQSWGGLIKLLALRGEVCFGPSRGPEVTFVRSDLWLGPGELPEPGQAEAELLRRYLRAYGPAGKQDYAAWSGITLAESREAWAKLGDEVIAVEMDGKVAYLLAEDLADLQEAGPYAGVRLLPNFDVFLLGHKEKGHLVDRAHYKQVYRLAGWISPVVLVDGRVAGTWAYARRGNALTVNVAPFAPLSAAAWEQVEARAADLGRFLGAETVAVTPPSS